MRHKLLGLPLPGFFCVVFLALATVHAQSSGNTAAESKLPAVTRVEIERLRPVVLTDLKTLLSRVENDPKPSKRSVEHDFLLCKFTPLKLGTLGRAILVEYEPGHGATNAAMLNIYLSEHGSYRRILEAAGFGPGPAGTTIIPDLVFGWASGVCHAKYYRYSFRNGQYEVSGCDQESEAPQPGTGDCAIQSCGGENLPSFPSPWPEEADQAPQSRQQLFVGSPLTGNQILAGPPR